MPIDRPIAIAIILFIILLLVFFLLAPEYNTFKKLQLELAEKIAQFNAEFDYYAEISRAYFELKSHQEDINKVDDALPEESDFGQIIYFLQETAKVNGLIVKDVFISHSLSAPTAPVSPIKEVKEIIFSMDLIGDYLSLKNFIASLEKSARIFEVSTISFTSEVGPPFTFTLQIKTYSY